MRLAIAFIILFSVSGVCAQQTADMGKLRLSYKSELERVLSDKNAKRLYDETDSYARILHMRIMKKLGLDPALDLFADNVLSSGAEAQSFDTAFVVNVTKNTQWQNETTISINRANKNLIIAGANDATMYTKGMPVYTTTNGGKNWVTNRIPITDNNLTPAGDPVLTCDSSGTFYYAYLADVGTSSGMADILVATSKDGSNWFVSPPVAEGMGIYFEDKEWLAVDDNPSSKYFGRVYVAWMRWDMAHVSEEENTIHVVWSDDGCKSWSQPTNLEVPGKHTSIRIGKNGEVIIVHSSYDAFYYESGDFNVFVSNDGGATFSSHAIAPYVNFPYSTAVGRPALKGEGGFRAWANTAFDIDKRDNSIHLVYCTWQENGVANSASQLYYTHSTNLGASWSEAQAVGVANPKANSVERDRFFPSLTIDRATNIPHLLYYSSELDPNNVLTAAYHVALDPSLNNYSECVSCVTFNPLNLKTGSVPFIGDYIGCDAYDSVIAMAWTQTRGTFKDGDVFVGVKKEDSLSKAGMYLPVVIHSPEVWMSAPYPNPVIGDEITVSYYLPQTSSVTISLYDIRGAHIATLLNEHTEAGTNTRTFPISGVHKGTYFLKLTSPLGETVQQIVAQ